MGKTGFRGHYYLLAGGAGAVVGFSYNAMSRNVLVEYANGILSRFVSDETALAILKRITPSLYGFGLAVVLLGISRRVRAHLVRALLSYDGWFLRGPKVNRKLVTLWALSLRVLLGGESRPIGGYQDFLPKYPLPPLDQTLDRYLESMKPILSVEEFSSLSESVEDFRLKDGPILHRYLWLQHLKSRNWVADAWLEHVYLRYRGPLPINSNYYTVDCRDIPTPHQLDRAAGYTHQVLTFIQEYDNGRGEKNIISQGIVPFDSYFYDHVVRGVRIPGEECDMLQCHLGSTHIVVVKNGKYFKVEVKNKKGHLISARQLKEKLQYVVNLAGDEVDERFIAALTAQDRPTWAKQRKVLETDPANRQALQAIDSALVFIVLENEPSGDVNAFANKAFHGNGRNTWFDKGCTIVFYTNGRHTGNIEHSFLDATVHEHMMECTFFREEYDESGHVIDTGEPDLELDVPRHMHWNFDGCEHFLEKAKDHYLKMVADSDLRMILGEYGKRVPKQCKISPDGWLQMAFQLAWYRLYKIPVLTYEAATTRMFYQGRTETIRPVSEYSDQFVKAFDDDTVSVEDKKQLLKKAIGVQERRKFLAMRGQGFDRHLFGLYVMAKYLKLDPFPAFLNGNAFAFRLSTSQTPTRQTNNWCEEKCAQGGGFGTVMEDGYGVSYMFIGEDRTTISVHSKKSHPFTDTDTFQEAILTAVRDMKEMFAPSS